MAKKHRCMLCLSWILFGLLFFCGCMQDKTEQKGSRDAVQTGLAYTTIEEANGQPMAVPTGMILDLLTKEYLPDSPYSYYNAYADCLAALQSGKVQGFLCDEPVARDIQRQNDDVGYIPAVQEMDFIGIGVRKDKAELKGVLDAGILRYEQDGTLQAMQAAWFGDDDTLKVMPEPRPGMKGTVICGVNAGNPPMSYVRRGEIVGYEPALVMHILQDAGYEVKLQGMDFNAMFPAAVSGKADVIMGAMSITEERKKSVLFTEPVYRSRIVLMVRDYGDGAADDDFVTNAQESLNRSLFMENRYEMVLQGLKITILITFFATLFGSLLGAVLCVLWKSSFRVFQYALFLFVKIMQGTPLVVFLMIMYYVVFGQSNVDAIYVAILAFAINFAASVSQMMRNGLDSVSMGEKEAAYAMGFTKLQTLYRIVLPQAVRWMLPQYTGEIISMLKMTSIVGYVAIQDLTKMSDLVRSRTYEAFTPLLLTALIYLVLAWLLTAALSALGRRLNPRKRQRRVKGVKL